MSPGRRVGDQHGVSRCRRHPGRQAGGDAGCRDPLRTPDRRRRRGDRQSRHRRPCRHALDHGPQARGDAQRRDRRRGGPDPVQDGPGRRCGLHGVVRRRAGSDRRILRPVCGPRLRNHRGRQGAIQHRPVRPLRDARQRGRGCQAPGRQPALPGHVPRRNQDHDRDGVHLELHRARARHPRHARPRRGRERDPRTVPTEERRRSPQPARGGRLRPSA